MQIAIAEAKAQFAELTRYVRPGARTVVADRPVGRPLIGALEGKFVLPDDLFAGEEEIAEMIEKSVRK